MCQPGKRVIPVGGRTACITSRPLDGAVGSGRPGLVTSVGLCPPCVARLATTLPHPSMGSELSRERRLLAAVLGAEARRGQGWPQATAGGGASAALSGTNSAPQWRIRNIRVGAGRRDVMRGLGRERQCGRTASPCIRSGTRPGTLIFHARVKAKPSKDGTHLRERVVCSPG